ncbi:hypothetical protein PISL3812_07278 [Talaromyces islandicus]|uniref:Uncharacterized protein n=1 Tax=Talaromyces islandicus TaxID=28573 RepID=A0A0U1M3V1_TALIS|nr:hypothetical protein PISL3812_07278 [Talaromyces islandicus]
MPDNNKNNNDNNNSPAAQDTPPTQPMPPPPPELARILEKLRRLKPVVTEGFIATQEKFTNFVAKQEEEWQKIQEEMYAWEEELLEYLDTLDEMKALAIRYEQRGQQQQQQHQEQQERAQ